MTGALTNLVAFIVAISVLVAVHEFGHYIVGALFGHEGIAILDWLWQAGMDENRRSGPDRVLPVGDSAWRLCEISRRARRPDRS